METKKKRKILAIVALVFMSVFTVSLIITFIKPSLLGGFFGYLSLVTGLFGVGLFIIVKYVLKEEENEPEYLPVPDDDGANNSAEDANTEEGDSSAEEEKGQSDESNLKDSVGE